MLEDQAVQADEGSQQSVEVLQTTAAQSDPASNQDAATADGSKETTDAATEAVPEEAATVTDANAAAAAANDSTEGQPKPAEGVSPTTPAKVYTTRVTPIDEEPYDFDKSTLLAGMQFMPVDGHPDGREVALTITTHRDIPILKLVRMKELEPLPPWLKSLLDEMQAQMPAYAEDAERRKEEEKAVRRAATARSTPTTAKNLKTSAGKKGAGSSVPKPGETTSAPVFEDQGSLFNLMTGQRPKTETAAGAEGGK